MSKNFFLFQTPDERLAALNDWAARDYTNFKLLDALAGDAEAQARRRAETLGLPPDSEETQADLDRARSALYRSAIQGAFAKNAIDAGLELHGRAVPQLIPADTTVLDPLVAVARERKIGRDYADALPSIEPSSMADLKRAHLDATAQNETDWPDDAGQRATNQHFIDVKFGTAMRDALDTQAELRRSVADWLTRPGSNGEAQTERPPVAMWAALSPAQREEVDKALRPSLKDILPMGSWMFPWEPIDPRTMPGIGIMPNIPQPPPLPKGLEWLRPSIKSEPPPKEDDRPGPTGWPDDDKA